MELEDDRIEDISRLAAAAASLDETHVHPSSLPPSNFSLLDLAAPPAAAAAAASAAPVVQSKRGRPFRVDPNFGLPVCPGSERTVGQFVMDLLGVSAKNNISLACQKQLFDVVGRAVNVPDSEVRMPSYDHAVSMVQKSLPDLEPRKYSFPACPCDRFVSPKSLYQLSREAMDEMICEHCKKHIFVNSKPLKVNLNPLRQALRELRDVTNQSFF